MENNQEKTKDFHRDIQIGGMTCVNCANRVERGLKRIEGVKFASVNLATETAFIISEREITDKEIKEAVQWAGYVLLEGGREDISQIRYKRAKERLILAWIVTAPFISIT